MDNIDNNKNEILLNENNLDENKNKINWPVYLFTFVSAIGGFLFGYDTVYLFY